MKNKFLTQVISIITICLIIVSIIPVSVQGASESIDEANDIIDSIIDYELEKNDTSSIQNWIDGSLTKNAGTTSEWYIITLAQNGDYDFSSYESALIKYLSKNTVYSATSRQKYALVLIAIGCPDEYISSVLEETIGKQGIMSWIYGLHLLNNGYTSTKETKSSVKEKILSLQLADGGWAISGKKGDVDVTAMAVQALAAYYNSDSAVNKAVNNAISFLSEKQLKDGDYSSYGVPNLESTAQVITTLSTLGIDTAEDDRFIKNGNTLFDGLKKYKLENGSFSHKEKGDANDNATSQAFYSMVSYKRMTEGKTGFYILDRRNPTALESVTKPSKGSEKDKTSKEQTTSKNKVPDKAKENPKKNDDSTTNINAGNDDNKKQTIEPESDNQQENAGSNDKKTGDEKSVEKNKDEKDAVEDGQTQMSENASITEKVDNTDEIAVSDLTEDTAEVTERNQPKVKTIGYKLWVYLAIILIAVILCGVLFVKGKRNKKNLIAIVVIAILAMLFVHFTDFKSPDEYYNEKSNAKENSIGTVTMTIRCDTIVGKDDSQHIPADGIILDTTEFEIEEGDTVYDVLIEAARKYNIQTENNGSEEMAYIAGINYIYEYDFGDLSGWIFYVDGESSSTGCSSYKLSGGEKIEWLYTCELGKDLE